MMGEEGFYPFSAFLVLHSIQDYFIALIILFQQQNSSQEEISLKHSENFQFHGLNHALMFNRFKASFYKERFDESKAYRQTTVKDLK